MGKDEVYYSYKGKGINIDLNVFIFRITFHDFRQDGFFLVLDRLGPV